MPLPVIPFLIPALKGAVVALGAISFVSLGLDALGVDSGVFEALRGWTCWFMAFFADTFQLIVVETFHAMPGRGLVALSMLETVWNWVAVADLYVPVTAGFRIFGLWCTVMSGITAVKILRLWILTM